MGTNIMLFLLRPPHRFYADFSMVDIRILYCSEMSNSTTDSIPMIVPLHYLYYKGSYGE